MSGCRVALTENRPLLGHLMLTAKKVDDSAVFVSYTYEHIRSSASSEELWVASSVIRQQVATDILGLADGYRLVRYSVGSFPNGDWGLSLNHKGCTWQK